MWFKDLAFDILNRRELSTKVKPVRNFRDHVSVEFFNRPDLEDNLCMDRRPLDISKLAKDRKEDEDPYPYIEARALLDTFMPTIYQTYELTGMTREFFGRFVFRLYTVAADQYSTLPASHFSHHSHPCGLIQHSIEVAHLSMKSFHSAPLRRFFQQPDWNGCEPWVMALVIARSLFHDWGKIMTDYHILFPSEETGTYHSNPSMIISNPNGHRDLIHWPDSESLHDRMIKFEDTKLRQFKIKWKKHRHRQHEILCQGYMRYIEEQLRPIEKTTLSAIVKNPASQIYHAVTRLVLKSDMLSSTHSSQKGRPTQLLKAALLDLCASGNREFRPSSEFPLKILTSGCLALRYPVDLVPLAQAISLYPESSVLNLRIETDSNDAVAEKMALVLSESDLLTVGEHGKHILKHDGHRLVILTPEISSEIRDRSPAPSIHSIDTRQIEVQSTTEPESTDSPFSEIDISQLGDPIDQHEPTYPISDVEVSSSQTPSSNPPFDVYEAEAQRPVIDAPLVEQPDHTNGSSCESDPVQLSVFPDSSIHPDQSDGALDATTVKSLLTYIRDICVANQIIEMDPDRWFDLDDLERPNPGVFVQTGKAVYIDRTVIKRFCKRHRIKVLDFIQQISTESTICETFYPETADPLPSGRGSKHIQLFQLTHNASTATAGDQVDAFMSNVYVAPNKEIHAGSAAPRPSSAPANPTVLKDLITLIRCNQTTLQNQFGPYEKNGKVLLSHALIGSIFGDDEVADHQRFGCTRDTLQKHLHDEGVSFQPIDEGLLLDHPLTDYEQVDSHAS